MNQTLFMILLGCTPKGRIVEQHDVFFGVGADLKSLIPEIKAFWPEANDKIHIDVWRTVTRVDKHLIKIIPRNEFHIKEDTEAVKLFFINLGGYIRNEFDERHHKMLILAKDKAGAIAAAKGTHFYKEAGLVKGAPSHIDDKYGFDVDDIHEIEDILPKYIKDNYAIHISKDGPDVEDEVHSGYLKLDKI